jgi:hypothetical protein
MTANAARFDMFSSLSTTDGLGSAPLVERNDPAWLSLIDDFRSFFDDLPASWSESTRVADRRAELRFLCDSRARLMPLDENCTTERGPSVPIVLTDISRNGIGFTHDKPLPYRLVQIAFGDIDGPLPNLVVRLQWCRFQKPGAYESGGRIQRVITVDRLA